LNLPSNAFDAVFSLGLMERLGSLDDVAAAAREIGRILRPGGVASIATEFRLDGPADRRWFDDRVMLFSEQTLAQYIVKASGLKLRVPLWTNQSDATFETRHQFADFRSRGDTLEALAEKRAVTPNLVLYHDGFLFCPVALTLHKDSPAVASDEPLDPAINTRVDEENAALAVHVERLLRGSALPPHPAAGDPLLLHEIERLRAEADWLRAEYERSNRWKKWRVMRPVRFVYHRVKRWRR
jgi:SAM-dependent methyltransferase